MLSQEQGFGRLYSIC